MLCWKEELVDTSTDIPQQCLTAHSLGAGREQPQASRADAPTKAQAPMQRAHAARVHDSAQRGRYRVPLTSEARDICVDYTERVLPIIDAPVGILYTLLNGVDRAIYREGE